MKPDNLEAILTTARKMFARYGLKKTSLDEIARTARVAKGTIYNYFGSKDQVYLGVLRGEAEEIVRNVLSAMEKVAAPEEKLAAFVRAKFRYMRQAINILAVDWAARRRTDEDVRKLRECFRNFEKTPLATEEDRHASARWENVLHSLIVDSAHNVILSRIYEGISFLMELNNDMMHMTLMNVNDRWVEHIIEQHRRIIDAIEARDSDAALREMKGHFEDTVKGLGLEKAVEPVRMGI
jgi:AcrR family transcriptional regulator